MLLLVDMVVSVCHVFRKTDAYVQVLVGQIVFKGLCEVQKFLKRLFCMV